MDAKTRFIGAAATATAAAFVIRHPIAFSIAAMLGVMVSDPDSMLKAMEEWKTTQAGGKTDELADLRSSVSSLLDRLEKDAKWEGGTAETTKQVMSDFVNEIDTAGAQRNGVGDALGSAARLYDTMSYVAMGIAAFMAGYAVAMAASTAIPALRVAMQAAATPVLQQTGNTTRSVLMTMMKFAMAFGALYMGVTQLVAQQATKFQQLTAMPNFGSFGLGNEPTTKTPTVKAIMDPSIAGQGGLPSSGGMPI